VEDQVRARKDKQQRARRFEAVDDALAWMDDLDEDVEKVTQARRPTPKGHKPKASGRASKASGRKTSPLPGKNQYPEPVPRLSRRADLLGHVQSTKLRRAQVMSDRRDAKLTPAEIKMFEEQKRRTRRLQKRRDAVRDAEAAGAEPRRTSSRQRSSSARAEPPKATSKAKATPKAKPKSRKKKQARPDTAPIQDALAWMDDADGSFDAVVKGSRRPAAKGSKSSRSKAAKAKAKAAKAKAAKAKAAKAKAAKAKAAQRRAARPAFELSDVALGADQMGPPADLTTADVNLLAQSAENLFVDEAPDTSDVRELPSESGELTFLDAAPKSKRLYPKKVSPTEARKRAREEERAKAKRDTRREKAEDLLTWMEDLLGAGKADPHAVRRQLAKKDYDRSAMAHLIRSAAGLQAKEESGDELPPASSETGRFDRRSLTVLQRLWTQIGKGQVSFGAYVAELERVMTDDAQTRRSPTPSGRVVTQRPVTEAVPVPSLADLEAQRRALASQRTRSSRLLRLEAQLRNEEREKQSRKRKGTSRTERLEAQLRDESEERRRLRSLKKTQGVLPAAHATISPLTISPDPRTPDAAFDVVDPFAGAQSDPFGLAQSDPFANDPFANDPFADAPTQRLADPYGGITPDPFAGQSDSPYLLTQTSHGDSNFPPAPIGGGFQQEPVARGWQSGEFGDDGAWSSYTSPALPTAPPPLPSLHRTEELASSSSSIEIIY
jgi:hypothetical protein